MKKQLELRLDELRGTIEVIDLRFTIFYNLILNH